MAPARPIHTADDVAHAPPAPPPLTYSCADCARRLGKAVDTFRRNLEAYYAAGMPRPLPGPGQRRWERGLWDAWRRGYLGLVQPANDAEAIDDHRLRMAAAYGPVERLTGT